MRCYTPRSSPHYPLSRGIATLPAMKMAFPPHKDTCLDTQYGIVSQLTGPPSHRSRRSGSEGIRESSKKQTERVYDEHAYAMEELHIGSQIAIQHPHSKMWEI